MVHRRLIRHIYAAVALLAWLIPEAHAYSQWCEFPEFVQSKGKHGERREWLGHIVRQNRKTPHNYQLQYIFKKHVLKATISGGENMRKRPKSYVRECLREVKHGRFLVAQRQLTDKDGQSGGELRYACMEFLHRSDSVMQVKVAGVSRAPDPHLCSDDRLVLDAWPFINSQSIKNSHVTCPLIGGFNVQTFDKKHKEGVCHAFSDAMRLESECLPGEGMFFSFRQRNCIPRGLHMTENQRVFCAGAWQHDAWTFVLLRHDHKDHQWCLRFPTNGTNSKFSAYLFKDVVCDPSAIVRQTQNYLRMDMTVSEPRPLSALCADDYEACSRWSDPCSFGLEMQLTCSKKCGLCDEQRPRTCALPQHLRGRWIEPANTGKEVVAIDDLTLSVTHFSQFTCINWDRETNNYKSGSQQFVEQMFVRSFRNGCRPRYACAQFQKRSQSILRYKLSQSQTWPFSDVSKKTSRVSCAKFHYLDDPQPVGDRFRSKHFKTIISLEERVYVDCKLRGERKFDVTFADGVVCSGGRLLQKGLQSRNKMRMELPYECKGRKRAQDFACLDSSAGGYISNLMIITESMDGSNRLSCWYFPQQDRDHFFLLPASECNHGALDKIRHKLLIPWATFRIHKRTGVKTKVLELDRLPEDAPVKDKSRKDETSTRAGLPPYSVVSAVNSGKSNNGRSFHRSDVVAVLLLAFGAVKRAFP